MRVQFLSRHHMVLQALLGIFSQDFTGKMEDIPFVEKTTEALKQFKMQHDNYMAWFTAAGPKLNLISTGFVDVQNVASSTLEACGLFERAILNEFGKKMSQCATKLASTSPPDALLSNHRIMVDPSLQKALDDPEALPSRIPVPTLHPQASPPSTGFAAIHRLRCHPQASPSTIHHCLTCRARWARRSQRTHARSSARTSW